MNTLSGFDTSKIQDHTSCPTALSTTTRPVERKDTTPPTMRITGTPPAAATSPPIPDDSLLPPPEPLAGLTTLPEMPKPTIDDSLPVPAVDASATTTVPKTSSMSVPGNGKDSLESLKAKSDCSPSIMSSLAQQKPSEGFFTKSATIPLTASAIETVPAPATDPKPVAAPTPPVVPEPPKPSLDITAPPSPSTDVPNPLLPSKLVDTATTSASAAPLPDKLPELPLDGAADPFLKDNTTPEEKKESVPSPVANPRSFRKRPAAKSFIRRKSPLRASKLPKLNDKVKPALADIRKAMKSEPKPVKKKKAAASPKKTAASPRGGAEPVWEGPPVETFPDGSSFPPGWIKRMYARKSGASAGHTDRYWYSPKENYKFRSMVEVRRFMVALSHTAGDETKAKKIFKNVALT